MTDFQRRPIEPGSQPDPLLEPRRRSSGWLWLFALAIVAVVFGTLYGINNQEPQTANNEPAATETTGQNAAPQSALPGGRGTADAPKQQQAKGQSGKSTTTGQGGQADQSKSDQGNGGHNNPGQQAPKQP